MDQALLRRLERIAAANIQLLDLPQIGTHFAFERNGFVALVEKRPGGFGGIGSPGLLTESGLAFLVGDEFVNKEHRQPASPEQALQMRGFLADLKRALD